MIYSELFGQHLRLGNFLSQYASNLKLSLVHNTQASYPDWYYLWKYLESPPITHSVEPKYGEIIRPMAWGWTQEEEDYINGLDYSKDVTFALNHFRQSAKWFEGYEREVYNSLKIKQEEIEKVKDKYDYLFNYNLRSEIAPTIGISIRLGDFVGHGDFYQIPTDWYIKALDEQFPLWDERKVVVFSDDIEKAKTLFKGKGFYYAEPNGTHTHAEGFKHYHSEKAAEQFILGTLMNDWIIGNSTFSWWVAWLATYNKPFSKVIHCGQVFRGKAKQERDISNYYHPSWIKVEI